MHPDLHTLQLVSIVAVFALLFLSRMAKGRARATPQGLSFPLKPLVVFSRAVALPLYFLLFAYPLWISRQSIPAWLLLMLLVATVFGLYQLPGTIVLTPTAITQRFWFRSTKIIPYSEVLGIAAARTGAVTRILGGNRVAITHTFNHSASEQFRAELARLSGRAVAPAMQSPRVR